MILPKQIIDNISYFEYTTSNDGGINYYDVITLHFKQWWKRKKVMKIRRSATVNEDNPELYTFSAGSGVDAMLNQLNGTMAKTHEGDDTFDFDILSSDKEEAE